MITKRLGRHGGVLVTFVVPASLWADTICVVGDFNRWEEQATPLRLTENGWIATLELEAGRSYQYRYLVNGVEWHNDWNADGYVPNRFGGDNSVVITPDFLTLQPEDKKASSNDVVLPFVRPQLRLISSG